MHLLPLVLLLAQGIPAQRANSGAVSGVLRTVAGFPAEGIRVAAAAAGDPADPTPGGKLMSLAETDKDGRYRLENIPAGRYYITAGRIDLPTYFPGTLDVTGGRIVIINAGSDISGFDFVLKDESRGRVTIAFSTGPPGVTLPVQIGMEDGGKVPLSVGSTYPELRLVQLNGPERLAFYLNERSLFLPVSSALSAGGYRVELANLPSGYAVKSMVYGSGVNAVDVTKNPLKISAQSLNPQTLVTFGVNAFSAVASASGTLFVELTRTPLLRDSNGVRVSGAGLPVDAPIYLSGALGTIYIDGSFSFEGVPSGRHSLVRIVTSTGAIQAASIVVGDRDLEGVKLQPSNLLPIDIEADAPRAAGTHTPTAILPFAHILGRIVLSSSGEPLSIRGGVTLRGYRNSKRAYTIDAEGRFDIPDLLPGSYRLDFAISGYEADSQTVVIDDGDADVIIRVRADESTR
jgi:hypothetical protein